MNRVAFSGMLSAWVRINAAVNDRAREIAEGLRKAGVPYTGHGWDLSPIDGFEIEEPVSGEKVFNLVFERYSCGDTDYHTYRIPVFHFERSSPDEIASFLLAEQERLKKEAEERKAAEEMDRERSKKLARLATLRAEFEPTAHEANKARKGVEARRAEYEALKNILKPR